MVRFVSLALLVASAASFAPAPHQRHQTAVHAVTRREAAFGLATALIAFPTMANAAAGPPTKADLDRLKVGYTQIQYLLDNFEKETTGE